MPCYTPEEDSSSVRLREISKLIVILDRKMGLITDEVIIDASNTHYGHSNIDVTEVLCTKIRGLGEEHMNEYIYNGRDADSRKLADWWDDHKKWDEERIRGFKPLK